MGDRAYLDHNASTPLRPAAAEAMTRALELTGNPSSVHAEGRAARAAIDRARHQVAAAVGGEARNVVFTSGATEALNTLLRPSPMMVPSFGARRLERLLILATEHSAALAGGGFPGDGVELIPVDRAGVADTVWLQNRLATMKGASDFASAMVAIQHANSETGVMQPVREASAIVRDAGGALVCDAVAAFGKISIDIKALDVDALVISAHKFGGPKGAGAIILNGDRLQIQEPLLRGGGQEMRRRSGTENVAGIVAMGVAAEEAAAAAQADARRISGLRDALIDGLTRARPDLVVFGADAERLPNTLCLAIRGLKAETALIALDLHGLAVSSGSACSSGKVRRSHVLEAMGVPADLAESALRFSLGWTTTQADIAHAIEAFEKVAAIGGRAAA